MYSRDYDYFFKQNTIENCLYQQCLFEIHDWEYFELLIYLYVNVIISICYCFNCIVFDRCLHFHDGCDFLFNTEIITTYVYRRMHIIKLLFVSLIENLQ